jgi:hypothetical protein
VVVLAGRRLVHSLYPAAEAAARLAVPGLMPRAVYALGFLWPQPAGRRLPEAAAAALGRLEPWLGARRPFVGWGRFVVVELERTGEAASGRRAPCGLAPGRRETAG